MKADWKQRDAWLFKGGDYPDKGVTADRSFLTGIAQRTNLLPSVPMDLEHGPTESVLDFGRVVPGSLQVREGRPPGTAPELQGTWLVGRVAVDPYIDQQLKHRGLSVLLNTAQGVISKLAVTQTPRVPGAAFSISPTLVSVAVCDVLASL